jgi:signal transduction histidine kinase
MPRIGSDVGLRRIARSATLALIAAATIVCSALVVLTTQLHKASIVLRDAVASVRLAEGAAIDLFIHERARDDMVRYAVANELRRKLGEARLHVTVPSEDAVITTATKTVEQYLATFGDGAAKSDRSALLQSAHRSLGELVAANVAQADRAQSRARLWDRLGNLIGISTGLVTIAILLALFLWIRQAVVRPALSLAAAMNRFGDGERHARCAETGAAELRAMARQFNAMADAIARRDEGRLAYLAGVAHDLRNPLAALQISIDGMKDDHPLPPEGQLRERLSIVRRQVTRLNRMVGDLLDASRIEAGHLSLRLEPRDLRAIVEGAVQLFHGVSSIHELRTDLPDEPIDVRCDDLRIEQILNNLLSNAIKYSPRGGCVRVAARTAGSRAMVSIADEGVGIPAEDIADIWEPFRRRGASTEMIPGVGLGLWVARRIVEAHGGTIAVDSRLGSGSTFVVSLPLSKPDDRVPTTWPPAELAVADV